jgi:hypothetical protein
LSAELLLYADLGGDGEVGRGDGMKEGVQIDGALGSGGGMFRPRVVRS